MIIVLSSYSFFFINGETGITHNLFIHDTTAQHNKTRTKQNNQLLNPSAVGVKKYHKFYVFFSQLNIHQTCCLCMKLKRSPFIHTSMDHGGRIKCFSFHHEYGFNIKSTFKSDHCKICTVPAIRVYFSLFHSHM